MLAQCLRLFQVVLFSFVCLLFCCCWVFCFFGGVVAFLLKGCGVFLGVGGFVYYFCFFFPYRHFPNIDITVNKSMLGVSLNKTNHIIFTIIKNKKQKQNIKHKASGERLTESGFTSTFRAVLRHTLFMGQSSP